MDINKAGEKVEQASGFFDKLNKFIKKHPIWFIVILIVAFFYWASTLPEVEDEYYEDDYYEMMDYLYKSFHHCRLPHY